MSELEIVLMARLTEAYEAYLLDKEASGAKEAVDKALAAFIRYHSLAGGHS